MRVCPLRRSLSHPLHVDSIVFAENINVHCPGICAVAAMAQECAGGDYKTIWFFTFGRGEGFVGGSV